MNCSRANWCEHFHGMMQQRRQLRLFKFATIYRMRLRKEPGKTRHYVGLGRGEGLGSSPIFKNLMSPTPRRKWYLTTGRRAH